MIDDARKNKRFEVELDLNWSIEGEETSGRGTLLDVSLPGACFRMNQPFTAKSRMIFTLEAPDVPALPKRGRLRWYRKLPGRVPTFVCGVIFEDGDDPAWTDWLEQAFASATSKSA
jgi:hypothetical protein